MAKIRDMFLTYGPLMAQVGLESGTSPFKPFGLNWSHKCNGGLNVVTTKKFCTACNTELAMGDITSTYEVSKGQRVEVTAAEKQTLDMADSKTISIVEICPLSAVEDLRVFEGSTYYLAPSAKGSTETAYAHIREQLKGRVAIAKAVLYKRDRLCLIRAGQSALTMQFLHYSRELRPEPTVVTPALDPAHVKMIDAFTQTMFSPTLDLTKYTDNYIQTAEALVQSKISGGTITATPAPKPMESPFMDQLKAMVALTEQKKEGQKEPVKAAEEPVKKPAKGKKGKAA